MAMRRERRRARPAPYNVPLLSGPRPGQAPGHMQGMPAMSGVRPHPPPSHPPGAPLPSPKGTLSGPVVPVEIVPTTPEDEDGWRLQMSHGGQLFWHHPEHGQQWKTPDPVRPCRWRVCYHTDGSTTFCNMEDGSQHDELPRPVPLEPIEDPSDWVEEKAQDGRVSWFNPRLMLVSPSCPTSLKERNTSFCHWFSVDVPGKGRGYIHKYTREAIYRDITQERRQRQVVQPIEADVSAEDTALGRKLMDYDEKIKNVLKQQRGSMRSVALRRNFLQKIKLEQNADGSAHLAFRDTNKIICQLTSEEADIYRRNPHIQQVFMNQRPFIRPGRRFEEADRIVHTDDQGRLSPRTPYARRQGEAKTTEFWSPRQVFVQDIEFLAKFGKAARTIVVVSGPGARHFNALSEKYFPDHTFIIYCSEPIECEPTRRIELRPKAFDLNEAEEFRNQDILFMCSSRSLSDRSSKTLSETMRFQQQWVAALRPRASRLRFFLPWPSKYGDGGSTTYLDGELRFPVWGILTGTECSLNVTDPDVRRSFSHRDFEGLMFHHNVTTRTTFFEHDVQGEGLDHCYDCSAEIFILSQWVKSNHPELDEDEMDQEVARLSYEMSRIISSGTRTLKVE